ncbi:MAG: class I adenylate-forming enzyme family protein [Acidimicrobiales bacterium]
MRPTASWLLRRRWRTPEERLAVVAHRYPGRDAVVYNGTRLLYGELWNRSVMVTRALRSIGVERPSAVAVTLRSPCHLACAHLALLRLGGATVLLDPAWPEAKVLNAARRASAQWVVVDIDFSVVDPILTVVDAASGVERRVAMVSSESGGPDEGPCSVPFSKRGQWPAVVLATAGTTGEPKLVEHTRDGVVAAYHLVHGGFREFLTGQRRAMRRLAGLACRKPSATGRALLLKKVWMTSLPVHRIAGYSLLLQALLGGETFVAGDELGAGELVRQLRSEHVTVAAVSPVMAELMTRVQDLTKSSFPHLLVIGLGSDRARRELPQRLEQRFGCAVVAGYGATELGGGVLATRLQDGPPELEGTVGTPFPGVKVRVVDNGGHPLPPGHGGRLQCKVPVHLLGRVVGEGTSAERVGPGLEPGHSAATVWVATGDRARVFADGRVCILGRADDVIVKGAMKIDPTEIERVLECHDGVNRAGVVGVPSARDVTRVVAFCQPPEGAAPATSVLRSHCLAHLPRSCVPDRIVVVGALPTTIEGKVLRVALRRWAAERPAPPAPTGTNHAVNGLQDT